MHYKWKTQQKDNSVHESVEFNNLWGIYTFTSQASQLAITKSHVVSAMTAPICWGEVHQDLPAASRPLTLSLSICSIKSFYELTLQQFRQYVSSHVKVFSIYGKILITCYWSVTLQGTALYMYQAAVLPADACRVRNHCHFSGQLCPQTQSQILAVSRNPYGILLSV